MSTLRENYLFCIQEIEAERRHLAEVIDTLRRYMPPENEPDRIGVVEVTIPADTGELLMDAGWKRTPLPSSNWLGFETTDARSGKAE